MRRLLAALWAVSVLAPWPSRAEPPRGELQLGSTGTASGPAAAKGRVVLEKLIVRGSFPKQRIRAAVQGSLGAVEQLYRRHLRSRPSLRGRLVVQLVLREHQGDIASARVEASELNHAPFEAAVLGVLRALRVHGGRTPTISVINLVLRFAPSSR
jgi:hypothetical protein